MAMKLTGIRAVRFATDPGMTNRDRMVYLTHLSRVQALGPWTDACDDHVHGEFTENMEVVNGCDVWTSTLTFQLHPDADMDIIPLGNVPQFWSFQDRSGQWYMLGNFEKPLPVSVCAFDNGSGTAETRTITVTWKSKTGRLMIVK